MADAADSKSVVLTDVWVRPPPPVLFSMSNSQLNLVWMDLEMTGLQPDQDRILEIAVLVTDADLNIIAEGPELVIHQSEEQLALMDEWNRKTHGNSGLTERVRASTVTEAEAQDQIMAFLRKHVGKRMAPLAGNSIHQDRRFIAKYMTEVDAYLHYRLVDVSTLKELARRWFPESYAAVPKKAERHRALEDIRGSVEELKFYQQVLFAERGDREARIKSLLTQPDAEPS